MKSILCAIKPPLVNIHLRKEKNLRIFFCRLTQVGFQLLYPHLGIKEWFFTDIDGGQPLKQTPQKCDYGNKVCQSSRSVWITILVVQFSFRCPARNRQVTWRSLWIPSSLRYSGVPGLYDFRNKEKMQRVFPFCLWKISKNSIFLHCLSIFKYQYYFP